MLTLLNHLAPYRFLLDGEPGGGGGAPGGGGQPSGSAAAPVKFLDFDLPGDVKVKVPEEAIKPLAAWRDSVKGELAKLTTIPTLQSEIDQLRPFKAQAEKAAADLSAAQTQVTAFTAKVAELEGVKAKAEAAEAALAQILENRMALVPEGLKVLIKGSTTLEKLQSYEDLNNAEVFKVKNPGPRLPGAGTASEMTFNEYNALPHGQRIEVQRSIQAGKIKLVDKRAV